MWLMSTRAMRWSLGLLLGLLANVAIANTPVTLSWDHLIPDGWDPEEEISDLLDRIAVVQDGTEEAWDLMLKIQDIWQAAPLQEDLDSTHISLRGFVVPLDGDANFVTTYLLVPYFGACIHSPPPPRNQMVLVEHSDRGLKLEDLQQVVEVTGPLSVNPTEMAYGEAGYTLKAEKTENIAGW